jgi:hypothetical protein
MADGPPPPNAIAEVTGDVRYTGGHLAKHGLDSG